MIFSSYPQRRVALKLSYDGTGYHGWQKQPKIERTIQGELERHLSSLLKASIEIDGASRTDAGVHAEDQLCAFNLQHPILISGLIKAINRRLSPQIAVTHAYDVPLDFQPRFINRGKRYRYRIYCAETRYPLIDRYATWIRSPLNREGLVEGLKWLHGVHDFTSFAASNGQHKTADREIWYTSLHCLPLPSGGVMYELRFAGDGFLKQMIRNLVGTLIEIGRGHWESHRVPAILEARDRSAAGPTAPARGLCLEEMFWTPPSELKEN